MKLILSLLIFGSSAALARPSLYDFSGKFKAGKGCGGSDAYGSLVYNKQKQLIGVGYSIFGNDPTGFGIRLEKRHELNSNWPDNPIQYSDYEGHWDGDRLVATETNTWGKDGLGGQAGDVRLVTSESIELTKNGVTYKEYNVKDGSVRSSCHLTRVKDSKKKKK
jgi:hypothetical protein